MLYISLNDLSRAPQTTKQLRFLRQEVKTIIIIINVHYLYKDGVHVCHINKATNWDIDTCSNTLHASMFYGDKADNLSCLIWFLSFIKIQHQGTTAIDSPKSISVLDDLHHCSRFTRQARSIVFKAGRGQTYPKLLLKGKKNYSPIFAGILKPLEGGENPPYIKKLLSYYSFC